VINPNQAVTDAEMSPPDPVLAIQRRTASFRARSSDNDDEMRPRSEKPQSAANGGTSGVQNGVSENRREKSQDDMV